MDIKAKIDEIVDKVKNDKNFASKFTSEPIKKVDAIGGTGTTNRND